MSTQIPNLWSNLIRPGILSPLAVLRSQGQALKEQTNSILTAEIESDEVPPRIKHSFYVVAPALDGFRLSLLEVAHHRVHVYPAYVLGPGLWKYEEAFKLYLQNGTAVGGSFRAESQDDFVAILTDIFNSNYAVSSLQGLIARATEI